MNFPHIPFNKTNLLQAIQIPDIVRIILQESEDELRYALNSGTASPNDMVDGTSSIVRYAFGWPKGIQILLEAGATESANNGRLPYVIDNDNEDTYHSVKLLLEAGWMFDWGDIDISQTSKGSRKIKSLLINELVARRKGLWHLAQSCLPVGQLPKLISDDEKTGTTTILDIHTAVIHDHLVKQGISINPIFSLSYSKKEPDCGSVYHYPYFTVETLDELYQVGFRGVTQLDWEGFMPLMTAMNNDFWWSRTDDRKGRKGMERIFWLISKGADPYQKVPGTSATAAHHLGLKIVDHFLDDFHPFIVIIFDKWKQYEVWKQMVSDLAKDVFLLPSIRDGCGCACSPSGCTTMSVLVRHIVRYFSIYKEEASFWFRELIQFLLWWTRGDTETGWGVIRFLTFDALGMKHSCCIKKHTYSEYRQFKLESREEEEVAEILDEEKSRLVELEILLDELKIKFDERGHPVMEFLEGYWHTRMIEVLSQRDPYDEEHIIESRRIGVTLEPDECVVPERVSLLLGSKIKYEIST